MIKVYIASPYTKGDVAVNVKAQLDTANELIELGYAPFVPLYYHFQHIAHPRPYKDWTKLDMEWLKRCDCLLRLSGDSAGADKEVEWAQEYGMDVVHSVEELERLKESIITQHIFFDYRKVCKHQDVTSFHENASQCNDCGAYV